MSKKCFLVGIGLALFLAGCASNKTCCEKETREEAQIKCAIAQANAGISCNPLTLEYRKLSTEEVSEYLEMDEKNVCAHLKAMGIHGYYSLIANNFPAGREFILYHIDYKGKINSSKTFFVCPDGGLVTPLSETTVNLSDNFLVFAKYLPGEPTDFVLGSVEGDLYVAARIVPNPIEDVTDKNQKLSLSFASPDGKRFNAVGEGLVPCGSYMLQSIFENEKLAFELTADENGRVCQEIGPTIPWVTNGVAVSILQGPGLCRTLQVKFTWCTLPVCDD